MCKYNCNWDDPYCLICALMSNQSDQDTTLTLICKTDETRSNASDLSTIAIDIVNQCSKNLRVSYYFLYTCLVFPQKLS